MTRELGRLLIIMGGIILLFGVGLVLFGRVGLGRLPGDIVYRRGGFTFYFPLMTCILLSAALSLILWLVRR